MSIKTVMKIKTRAFRPGVREIGKTPANVYLRSSVSSGTA